MIKPRHKQTFNSVTCHIISCPPNHLSKKNLRVSASPSLRVSLNDKYISDETLREQPDMISLPYWQK